MSDPTPTPAVLDPKAATPAPAADAIPAPQGDPADLGDAGKKALKAERDRADAAEKAAKGLQAQIDKINQANESAVEKAQREATEAQENAKTATVSAFRQAAVKFGGISAEDAELFLTGSDTETLEKQAARLADRTSTGPKPDLSQGSKGSPASGSPEADFANFLGSTMSGRG